MRLCRKVALLLLCTAALSLSACSIKLAYNMLDNLMAWELSRYVDLKGEQKKLARELIDDFHSWHRKTQLTRYADYLETLKNGLYGKTVSADYLHAKSDELQDLLDDSMDYLAPALAQLAASLSEKQIEQVCKQLEKDRDKYRKDYIDDKREDIQRRRIRDLKRYIGPFFGRFEDEQEKILKDWDNTLEPYATLMLAQQRLWQEDFLQAMAVRDNAEKLRPALAKLMLHRTDSWDPKLQKALDQNQTLTFETLAKLFNSQSPRQQEVLKAKFDDYIDTLRDLAKG